MHCYWSLFARETRAGGLEEDPDQAEEARRVVLAERAVGEVPVVLSGLFTKIVLFYIRIVADERVLIAKVLMHERRIRLAMQVSLKCNTPTDKFASFIGRAVLTPTYGRNTGFCTNINVLCIFHKFFVRSYYRIYH